ncbi:patatin-like phospholipase family protein [Patulibacter brassicae]|uniref:Patatin-like phospholipase family protein n=1 Tax=Patulibacter brassicae TaxID=1705717 RepID=A0ABU4VJY0_9ACTN|nr:patatin-like phospholipase family protein [Patulibacter brassicae]MDX8152139.1 patatin-like phospholipase family protein [Patulibacter brassicae]
MGAPSTARLADRVAGRPVVAGASPAAGPGDRDGGRRRIAVVLPGGGARGAYEVGALSVLAPALAARGERPAIACGTSVGAINAAFLASVAHLPLADQAALAQETWRSMRKDDVIRPVLGPSLLTSGLRAVGEVLQVPGVRLSGLLDARPLAASLERWVDWRDARENVAAGRLEALCVIATALRGGGPVGFLHATDGRAPAAGPTDGLRWVPVDGVRPDHVRASAAIPLLFPPVEVTTPPEAADQYIDGGVRLNAPLAPALALGADRVIVIGLEPFAARTAAPRTMTGGARLADVAANVLDGLLVDQVADDVHRMASINSFLAQDGGIGPVHAGSRAERAARGKPAFRRISYALVAPAERGRIGRIADEVFQERYAGVRGWRHPDLAVASRLLGGARTGARGELLSFLLFDEVFVERLIAEGAADAQRWLDRHPGVWCDDAAHDLTLDTTGAAGVRERVVLDEWRAMRRR